MRIWDIAPKKLCRQHLLGEHRELHAVWSILTKNKCGYRNHPETQRWIGKLKALYMRHEKLVLEMKRRGYCHLTPLEYTKAIGVRIQKKFIDKPNRQVYILRNKPCSCFR
ncbi:pyrimidine dimer DNA glycosylase/endonuclease V [Patescibacteria group bacterium]